MASDAGRSLKRGRLPSVQHDEPLDVAGSSPRSQAHSDGGDSASSTSTATARRKIAIHPKPLARAPPTLAPHPPHESETASPKPTKAMQARGNASASFRNISACNRCRLRKNRCDQELPACQACQKTGSLCIGFDPFLNREIPRSYVYYLETRTIYLERLVAEAGISVAAPDDFASVSGPDIDHPAPEDGIVHHEALKSHRAAAESGPTAQTPDEHSTLAASVGFQPVPERSQKLGPLSGISFAKVMFAAVRSSVPKQAADRRPSLGLLDTTSMRDSVFGQGNKATIEEAPFPDRELGLLLAELYFEYANPQIPVLHREEFMDMFDSVYNRSNSQRTPRESYFLYMVFAIGAGIILDSGDKPEQEEAKVSAKKARKPGRQHEPEEYHAAAVKHLDNIGATNDKTDGFGRGLDQLQATLLLAAFALLRPVSPGLWYISGNAIRLAVDLGLHYEDGVDLDEAQPTGDPFAPTPIKAGEVGRRQWMRDMRRRLWWCAYTFDRLVGTVVGRPFSISDQVITTEFPSILEDAYITKNGFLPGSPDSPSYKHVSYHYIRLRLLQSEIVQVLQYQSAQRAHHARSHHGDPFMHSHLISPFMARFASFRAWRDNVHQRLEQWRRSAPTAEEAGVRFDPRFLELNYWQAVILLYRQSVITPAALAEDMKSINDGMDSPHAIDIEEDDEEEETIYLRIAEAGQKVLKIYRHLHRLRLVNYTYLATHHLFMAGVGFLYAIWHSPTVRSYLSIEAVDSTLLAASSVLGDLIPNCPPAESCKTAFDRMSRATVQMCLKTTGFGSARKRAPQSAHRPQVRAIRPQPPAAGFPMASPGRQAHFDMNLTGLLSGVAFERPSTQSPGLSQHAMGSPGALSKDLTPSRDYFGDFPPFAGQGPTSPMSDRNSAYSAASPLDRVHASPPVPQAPQAQAQRYEPVSSSFDSFSDLSFLGDYDMGAREARPATAAAPGLHDFDVDSLMADPMGGNVANLHIFGIGGLDGSHDYADGSGGDLFGGFFFGQS